MKRSISKLTYQIERQKNKRGKERYRDTRLKKFESMGEIEREREIERDTRRSFPAADQRIFPPRISWKSPQRIFPPQLVLLELRRSPFAVCRSPKISCKFWIFAVRRRPPFARFGNRNRGNGFPRKTLSAEIHFAALHVITIHHVDCNVAAM